MNTKCAAIVCETIRDEYTDAAAKCGRHYETRWIESGQHNFPEKLRGAIQRELDCITASRVLLCFGTCGNAMIGLETREFELIMPRVDDCISLLIGSVAERMRISAAGASYFLTAGWLRGERNIYVEYEYAIKKYGEETGKSIMSMMLASYKNLVLLDTGRLDADSVKTESEMIAEKLGLDLRVVSASVDYISELLTGPYPAERFFVFPPNTKIKNLTV